MAITIASTMMTFAGLLEDPPSPHVINWDTVVHDNLGAWSAVNPSRLTVPPGVTHVRLSASVDMNGVDFGLLWIQKMGVSRYLGNCGVSNDVLGSGDDMSCIGPILEVSAGDWFNVIIQSNNIIHVVGDGVSWFTMEAMG